jgi:hypothetical protein
MDPDPGGPKTCGSCGYGSGTPTLGSSPLVEEVTYRLYFWFKNTLKVKLEKH